MTLEIPQFLSSLKRILANFDAQTFKVEEYYLFLKEKQIRTNDEELIFKSMDYFRILLKKYPSVTLLTKQNLFFDWDSIPISYWEWSFKCEYLNKHVAKDILNGYFISTVWLGMNLSCERQSLPLIFETMIFKENDAKLDNEELDYYQERYSTYEEALAGHEKACELVIKNTKEIIHDNHNQNL